jgi:hypothetical protein
VPADATVDFVVMFVVVGMVLAGLASVALGWVLRQRDRFMSRYTMAVPRSYTRESEHGSQAVGRHGNGVEPLPETEFQSVIDYLEHCDNDVLLNLLAQLTDAEGDYRFAESRVAKFIPGRVEDRLSQVRAVRDTTPPPPPRRHLRVKDDHGERLIPMDA